MTYMNANTAAEKTAAQVLADLSAYDIITFDIFDTLITRCVLRPADVFAIVEAQAKKQGFLNRAFATERRRAEQLAYQKYGETANFRQIYETLQERFPYTEAQSCALMALELETELRVAIPRVAVRELLLALRNAGKRILLCSDMYLSSQDIQKLLVACGYPGDLEIWVSCEKGGTKDSGKLWEKVFAYLPADQRIIHVGDNPHGDDAVLKEMGRASYLFDSGMARFRKTEMYDYLSKYTTDDPGNTLVLGYLVNKACFNSPFQDIRADESVTAVWGGAIFACFMDYLVSGRDDSQLLFVTREGYLLKPMYERYCKSLGIRPQKATLFYSSRAATIAATVTSEEDVRGALQRPEYQGTLAHFVKSRMNFDISFAGELGNREVSLPRQKKEVFQMLQPYFQEIFRNGQQQKDAYQQYVALVRETGAKLTVVDVGYNGTIQYALSRILSEKVSGIYMFLNDGALPKKTGCACRAIANPRQGQHPLYDNLLFLEAVMQVPYGQIQRMEIRDGKAEPISNADGNFSEYIPVAQEQFCRFAEWIASWKKDLADALELRFDLAEAIWVCLLKWNYLPEKLLESFWLADDFCGHALWKYDIENQQWQGSYRVTPLAFALEKRNSSSLKTKVKNLIKRFIPYFAYDFASRIWIRYFK